MVFDFAENISGQPSAVVPSGFTQITTVIGTFGRALISYKIANGTEAGTSVNGMDGTFGEAKLTYVFRGDVPIASATPADPGQQATSGNPTAQTVNASGGAAPLIVFGCYESSDGTVDPRTFSTTKDGEITVAGFVGGGSMYLAYKIYNTAPQDSNIDMDDEGIDNFLISCYIACA